MSGTETTNGNFLHCNRVNIRLIWDRYLLLVAMTTLTPRLATISLRRLPMTSLFLRIVSTECSRTGWCACRCCCDWGCDILQHDRVNSVTIPWQAMSYLFFLYNSGRRRVEKKKEGKRNEKRKDERGAKDIGVPVKKRRNLFQKRFNTTTTTTAMMMSIVLTFRPSDKAKKISSA